MGVGRVRRAHAFAPGHVTGVFAPRVAERDPRARGSVGAGIVLELGVHALADFSASGPTRFRLTSDLGRRLPISEEAGRRLFAGTRGKVRVHLTHELPVGQGFGTSAAGALATALAVARVVGRSREEAVEAAHLCELFGGGGLGGVAAILGGGIEVRRRAGIPPWGEVVHRALRTPMFIGVIGDAIPSPRLLSDRRVLQRVERASSGLAGLGSHPSLASLLELSEQFTDRVGLAPPSARAVIRGLRRRGAWAAQAMFGSSFFAVPRTSPARSALVDFLDGRGLHALELRAARSGARLFPAARGYRARYGGPRAR